MVDTRSGAAGMRVASHVMEELSVAIVHALSLDQHMEGKAAGGWDALQNHEDVTHINAQVKVLSSVFFQYPKHCRR